MNEGVQIHYSPHFCLVKNLTIYGATASGLLMCTSWSPFTSIRWKFCLLVTSSRCFVIYLAYLATTAGAVVRSARVGHVTPFNIWKYQMTQLSVNKSEKKLHSALPNDMLYCISVFFTSNNKMELHFAKCVLM